MERFLVVLFAVFVFISFQLNFYVLHVFVLNISKYTESVYQSFFHACLEIILVSICYFAFALGFTVVQANY